VLVESAPELVLFDVNETLSDLAPMREAFESVGLAAEQVEPWFAGVLRDGFALTAAGQNPRFSELAAELLKVRLAGQDTGAAAQGALDGAVDRVMAAFTALQVHDDVAEGIRTLRESGVRVVTLSNGSASVAQGLLERAGVRDLVEQTLSVEDAPAWKPSAAVYEFALERCAVPAERTALVAVHPWDVDGACRAGLTGVWLNRTGARYPSYFTAPDVTVPDLRELPAAWA
jgi:2-haloacid dehalogenase